MGINTKLEDGCGRGYEACITSRGQLVVGNTSFSSAYNLELGTAATPGNLIGPSSGNNFIITDILIYANRNVGANDARVTIYESTDGPATATESKILFETDVPKSTNRDLVGLSLEVTEGSWVNAVTDDDDVLITLMGYYIKTDE